MRRPTLLCVLLLAASPARATDITACYQTITTHDVGTLQVDLACDGSGGPNVTLQAGTRLELNGHTISGGHLGVGIDPGSHRVVIEGPGTIVAAAGTGPIFGCAISAGSPLLVEHVQIHNNDCGIVTYYTRSLFLRDVQIADNTEDGVRFALPVKHGKVDGRNVSVSGNGGNGIVAYRNLLLRDAAITGNAAAGVEAARGITMRNSVLSGNGPQGDVAGFFRPRLKDSTCEHSVNLNGGTFGICSLD